MRQLLVALLLAVPFATAGDEPDACAGLYELSAAIQAARSTALGSYTSVMQARRVAEPVIDDFTVTELQAGRVVERILEAHEILTRLQRRLACVPLA